MKFIVTLILWALVTPVYAGSITIQVVQSGQTVNKTYTIPDADITRIINTYQSGANTVVNGTASKVQVLNYWAQKFIDQTKADVTANDTNAAVLALPPIVPINPQ